MDKAGEFCSDCLEELNESIRIADDGICWGCGRAYDPKPLRPYEYSKPMTDSEFSEWYKRAVSEKNETELGYFWAGDKHESHTIIAEKIDGIFEEDDELVEVEKVTAMEIDPSPEFVALCQGFSRKGK